MNLLEVEATVPRMALELLVGFLGLASDLIRQRC